MADLSRRIVLELLARNKAKGELAAFQKQTASLTRGVQSMGRSMLQLAGVGGGVYLLGSQLRSAVEGSMDFEYGLAKVSTMLDETAMRHLPMLSQGIEDLSVKYGKGVADLNAATYTILSNQIPAAEALGMLETNIRAAKGGFTDTAVTVKATVGLLKAYQLEADRAGYVTNLMHKIVQRGNLYFEDVAGHIGTVSSSAAVLDVDLEALGATLATLTRAGIPVEKAFTGIRNILNTFKDPTDEAQKVAAQLGFNLDYTSIKGAGLVTIMQKLAKANERQLGILMPNVRGFAAFAAGLQNSTALGEDYAYMLSDVQAQEINFGKENATTKARMDETCESWDAAKRSFGDQVLPALTGSLKGVTYYIEQVATAIENSKKAAESFNDYVEKHGLAPPGKQNYGSWAPMPPPEPVMGPSQDGRDLKQQMQRQQALAMMAQIQMGGLKSLKFNDTKITTGKTGTEGVSAADMAAKQLTYADELIEKMRRENELLAMSAEERAKAAAADQMREAIQRDINIGSERSAELTESERQIVENLAAEHLRLSEQKKKSTVDIAAAYVRMYEEIDSKSAASFDARRRLAEAEYEEYAKIITDKIALEEYYRNRMDKLAIDRAKGGDDFFAGVGAGIEEMKRELPTLGQLGADLAVTLRDGVVGSLADAVFEARSLGDAMNSVLRSMGRMAFEWGARNLMTAALPGMGDSATAVAITTAGTTAATAITTAGATAAAGYATAGATAAAGYATAGATIVAGMSTAGATISASIITAGATAAAAITAASITSSITPNAKGNVFGPSGLMRFGKGAIVSKPTIFPFKNGTGLMGEAGKEGILPLGRDSKGRLGVHTTRPSRGGSTAGLESRLDRMISLLEQRQTINANIVDKRDVVTRDSLKSREGEKMVMYHVSRNS